MLKNYDVAVIFGGASGENEVSIITGTMVCNVLTRGGKSVLPIYIDHDGAMRAGEELSDLSVYKGDGFKKFNECSIVRGGINIYNKRGAIKRKVQIGVALNCCHGGVCEGGAVAGAFALCKIPFASPNLFASSVFLDKYYTKLILKSLDVKTANYVYSRDITGAIDGAERLGYPVIVKPATLGSSIGVEMAEDIEHLKRALATAFALDCGVLIEKYLSPRREINCAVYFSEGKLTVSKCEEAISDGDVLSYDDKYSGGGKRVFPAELDWTVAERIRGQTALVYSALNLRGIVRFDYIICKDEIYLSEINTVPGSLSQYLLSNSFKDFYSVLNAIIEQARVDFDIETSKTVIKTGILNNISQNTCKLK